MSINLGKSYFETKKGILCLNVTIPTSPNDPEFVTKILSSIEAADMLNNPNSSFYRPIHALNYIYIPLCLTYKYGKIARYRHKAFAALSNFYENHGNFNKSYFFLDKAIKSYGATKDEWLLRLDSLKNKCVEYQEKYLEEQYSEYLDQVMQCINNYFNSSEFK